MGKIYLPTQSWVTCNISEKDLHFGIHCVVIDVAGTILCYLRWWVIQIVAEIGFLRRSVLIDAYRSVLTVGMCR